MLSFFRGLHSPHILFHNAVLIPFILSLPFLFLDWTTVCCCGWYLASLTQTGH
jgi:hypothetical protein